MISKIINKDNMNKIVKNLIIEYYDGKKDFIEIAQISSHGIITGYVNQESKFIETGFIPLQNIQFINTNVNKRQ